MALATGTTTRAAAAESRGVAVCWEEFFSLFVHPKSPRTRSIASHEEMPMHLLYSFPSDMLMQTDVLPKNLRQTTD